MGGQNVVDSHQVSQHQGDFGVGQLPATRVAVVVVVGKTVVVVVVIVVVRLVNLLCWKLKVVLAGVVVVGCFSSEVNKRIRAVRKNIVTVDVNDQVPATLTAGRSRKE